MVNVDGITGDFLIAPGGYNMWNAHITGNQIQVSAIRSLTKLCVVSILGRESRPRTILRGLAAGYTICISPAENLACLVGSAEPHLQRAIRKYVAAGDTVYDVGANMGYFSLALAKQVGPAGRVIAFEPVPQNLELLRTNINNNHLQNVQVFDSAASDRNGEATIRIADSMATGSLIWHKSDAGAIQFQIRTVAIDDLVDAGRIPKPSFIKVGVEGAEGLALSGMRRTVAVAKPVLFIETSETGRETTWSVLRELGYRCQEANTRKWVERFEEYRHSDFLWLPPARAQGNGTSV